MKTSTLQQSNQVKHITPMKISLMNNYKYNNNNYYYYYEANWGTYEIKRSICTAIKSNIYS